MKVINRRNILNNFSKNTALPAWGYLVKKSKFERIFWICGFALGITSIVYITVGISRDLSAESVYVTLDASSHRITQVDFPAVAICDINKISRQRAIQLANNLSNYATNKSFQEILKLIKILGNFYDANIYGATKFAYLQNILNAYDNVTTETNLIVRLLISLITPCEDLLLNCSWDSVSYKCMDLFQTRFTDSGFCCTFNYVQPPSKTSIFSRAKANFPNDPRKFMGTGVTKGLSVTINNNVSDYFYTTMATRGSLLKLFLARDFPDLSSGALKQIVVQERSEVFVNVEANVLIASNHVRSLPIEQRKCKFADDEITAFGNYTNSNCLLGCKLRSIRSLCNCVPFNLPAEGGTKEKNYSICNLLDIPCLNRYKGKWLRYYPTDAPNVKELSLDVEDSLLCKGCYPNCDDTTYDIDTNYFEFFSDDVLYRNSSRIHIYSNKAYINLYKKRVTVTWYESLSTFGGIASILLGISIINLVEIGVLVLKLLVDKFKRTQKK